jgi:flagellar biogenesis protein FliO
LNKQLFIDVDAQIEPDVDFETDEVDQEDDPEKNKIQSNDEGFQNFMLKATKIVSIFLKDK